MFKFILRLIKPEPDKPEVEQATASPGELRKVKIPRGK